MLSEYFNLRYLFIPLSVQKIKVMYPGIGRPWAGFMRIRIFGLRNSDRQSVGLT